MRARWLLIAVLTAALSPLFGAENGFGRKAPLKLSLVDSIRADLGSFDTLELHPDLSATFDNPFDPEDISLSAVFVGPNGKRYSVNGFYDRSFQRRLEGNTEKIEPTGEPHWTIRFTPDQPGSWKYQLFAKDRSGSAESKAAEFKVNKSDRPGFIRRSSKNPRMFAWDNGKAFFGVGENVCWGGGRGSFDYDDWLPPLARAGGNFIRVWMCSWNCALEWAPEGGGERRSGSYRGVGIYSLDNAWKLDSILDIAERQGIAVMLCLGTYGEFNVGGYFGEGQWKANPYNVENGGPCSKPEEFWTNPQARKLYQQRLRYVVARCGHRTNLHSWEFWNEAKAPTAWIAEMARYLKATGEFSGNSGDPYRHLLTTTYGTPEVWNIPEIDYTQTHSYFMGDKPDHAPVVAREAAAHATYGKPHWTSEFGIDWRSSDSKYDSEGAAVNFHNAIWASSLSGDGGAALIWWWDNYIHPKNLYSQLTGLRRFVDEVPWTEPGWKQLTCTSSLPQVRVCAMANPGVCIAWVQNSDHNWKNVYEKDPIASLKDIQVKLGEVSPGDYAVEWWDTDTATIIRREDLKVEGDGLALTIPELATDVALRATRR